jgi:isoaspartyl peptidase/L-asparaginase-like protein (Ntn-hydrolase superfamily)
MKWAIIGTWRMCLEGIIAAEILKRGGDSGDAVEEAVKTVEDYPLYQ